MRSSVGGTPSYQVGEIVDLPTAIAQAWIDDGLAELEDVPLERAVDQTPVSTRTRKRR